MLLSHSAAISCLCSLRRSFHAPLRTHAICCIQKRSNLLFSLSPAALPFDLSPPPIDLDPLERRQLFGTDEKGKQDNCFGTEGVYNTISAFTLSASLLKLDTVPLAEEDETSDTYADADEALDAVGKSAVVVDLSDYGRIRVSGEDRIRFLHNQTTANFECLGEGQGCDTVLVTPTARTIDLSHAWVMKNGVLLVVSPTTCGSITEMLKKYIFFADKVEIQDITKQTSMFALLGPKSSQIMEVLNLGDLVGKAYGSHKHYSVDGMPLTVAVGSINSVEGFTFMMSPAAAKSVWKALTGQGAVPMSSDAWETLRILQGRPGPGKELTEEFNVLEAGLWRAVSLNKGCYKGQETIARLVTYDGIKQTLWGIRLSSGVEPGSIISVDGKKVGKLTSYTAGTKTSGPFGLGYVKRRAASEGNSVTVGENVVGTLVEVPFLRDQVPPPKS